MSNLDARLVEKAAEEEEDDDERDEVDSGGAATPESGAAAAPAAAEADDDAALGERTRRTAPPRTLGDTAAERDAIAREAIKGTLSCALHICVDLKRVK